MSTRNNGRTKIGLAVAAGFLVAAGIVSAGLYVWDRGEMLTAVLAQSVTVEAMGTPDAGVPAFTPYTLENIDRLPEAATAAAPNVPPPIDRDEPATLRVDIRTTEFEARLDDGVTFHYWTFNDAVPGPFIRIREGDTLVINFSNSEDSMVAHSIDLHAVTGPGGGADVTQTLPGDTTAFAWKALKPGLYVYHCATVPVAMHLGMGMYGMILVEPEEGLPPVDREYYVMQQEVYTQQPVGTTGNAGFDYGAMQAEEPNYIVFNGAVGSLTGENALRAEVGETVRLYFGVGGPNLISSFHVIGEMMDRVYDWGSLSNPPTYDVQTTLVPPGGAIIADLQFEVPGTYALVDHALSRVEKGLSGRIVVEGAERPDIFTAIGSR